MAAASKSPAQVNSPRNRQSRRSSASRGVASPPPPLSLSETFDQEQFVNSSSTTSSDTFPSKEAIKTVVASSSLVEDGSAAGADAHLDNSENGGAAKKQAWNKPSNGAAAEVGAVMGAESWPALSETARTSPKASSTCSLKALSNGSIITSEGMAAGSLSSQKEADTSISTPNSASNHVAPTSQGSMKQVGDSSNHSSMPANGSLSEAPPMLGAVAEALPQNAGNSGGSVGESNRDNTHRDAGRRGRSFGGNELQLQHSSFRSNGGPQARGDGSYHHRHGARRDLHRNFGSRESLASQKRDGFRPFIRGSAPNAPFIPRPPPHVAMRPFVTPMVYQEVPSHVFYVPGLHPDSHRPMPMVPFAPMLFPMPDPHLLSKILNQIDYYFSNENLVKDTFLRQNMDGEGWVSIKLIAGFKKVMQLTDNIHLILDAIKASNVVEVQGDKVRRRSDWIKWIIPPIQYSTVTSHSINESSQDILAERLDSVTLGEKART